MKLSDKEGGSGAQVFRGISALGGHGDWQGAMFLFAHLPGMETLQARVRMFSNIQVSRPETVSRPRGLNEPEIVFPAGKYFQTLYPPSLPPSSPHYCTL